MAMLDPAQRRAQGAKLQAEYTATEVAPATTPVGESWRDFIFAEIWSRPGLELRARFLISLASAAGAGDPRAVNAYARGALQTGTLSQVELREAALHVAVYSGWSAGRLIDEEVGNAIGELGLDPVETEPLVGKPWDPQERMERGFAEFNNVMTFDGPRVGNGFAYLQDGILNFVFGEMWHREGLDQRSRRFLTLVGVADSAANTPIRSHFHAAMGSGNCTAEELHEFVLQYGVHAGWPKASVVQGVIFEVAAKIEKGLPWDG
ncbi:carboxymuconolactone decarboxylase family protein [Novosphingobium sp. YJ-S2-02]|uniref:Carboxymuconolactone decarboxylase family protein n=1 Tax=Novosphingobium aureum TaxID=2792964 RepID=A0A931MK55_9SPHN|nr:carboxymuconolactone decarboxylase family protein [Novosphingobium aureum]MBH0112104.1 carboxymuconolactone decarboxylase family protein [Novosphingobium aureum]